MSVGFLTTQLFSCYAFHFSFHAADVYRELATPSCPAIVYNLKVEWLLVEMRKRPTNASFIQCIGA
jgi:hypothetical protein